MSLDVSWPSGNKGKQPRIQTRTSTMKKTKARPFGNKRKQPRIQTTDKDISNKEDKNPDLENEIECVDGKKWKTKKESDEDSG